MIYLLANPIVCIGADIYNNINKDARPVESSKPEIIKVFACSDYCPGPEDKYMVKAYKDINNTEECLKIGGKPHKYVGWSTIFVCIAE